MQLEKLKENEKIRMTDLNEEVSQQRIQLNLKQTKMEILLADLQARENEIKILKEKIEKSKITIESNEDKMNILINEMDKLVNEND